MELTLWKGVVSSGGHVKSILVGCYDVTYLQVDNQEELPLPAYIQWGWFNCLIKQGKKVEWFWQMGKMRPWLWKDDEIGANVQQQPSNLKSFTWKYAVLIVMVGKFAGEACICYFLMDYKDFVSNGFTVTWSKISSFLMIFKYISDMDSNIWISSKRWINIYQEDEFHLTLLMSSECVIWRVKNSDVYIADCIIFTEKPYA